MSNKLSLVIIGALVLVLAIKVLVPDSTQIVLREEVPHGQILKLESVTPSNEFVMATGDTAARTKVHILVSWREGSRVNVVQVNPAEWPQFIPAHVGQEFTFGKLNGNNLVQWK
jgi:hypothetical protein